MNRTMLRDNCRIVSAPEQELPDQKPVLMITWQIESTFGGMTSACLKRASTFHENDVPSGVVTFAPTPDLETTRKSLITQQRIHPDVPIVNLHEYYATTTDEIAGVHFEPQASSNLEVKEEVLRVDGTLFYQVSQEIGNPESEYRNYYRKDGTIYLTDNKYFRKGKKYRSLQVISRNNKIIKKFDSASALYSHWLSEIVDLANADTIFDSKFTANIFNNWNHEKALKFFCFHSTHVGENQNLLTAELNNHHKKIISNKNQWDGLVFLTKTQMASFESRFGRNSNIFNIGNAVSRPNNWSKPEDRSPKKIIFIGRLAPGKNLDFTIQVISALKQQQIPVELAIYGDGPQREPLEEQVKDLGLSEEVHFHGHSNKISQHLTKAKVLVLFSKFEGQSLAILEAQAHGCVPVAYDVNFGPRDIIEDGRNGFLVQLGDKDAAVDRIKQLLQDSTLFANMSKTAFLSAWQHSPEEIFKKWHVALETARDNKKDFEYLSRLTRKPRSLHFKKNMDLELIFDRDKELSKSHKSTLILKSRVGSFDESLEITAKQKSGKLAFLIGRKNLRQFTSDSPIDIYLYIKGETTWCTLRVAGNKEQGFFPYLTKHHNLSLRSSIRRGVIADYF